MFAKWAAKITPDNVAELIEYGARFGKDLNHIKETLLFNAIIFGEDTYLLVFNPSSPASVNFDECPGSEFEERYLRIPVYHPEGHFQQFELNV
jgi:hypothetical protein